MAGSDSPRQDNGRGYDFEEVKRTAARMVERIIEDCLNGEIPDVEWNRVTDLLKRYDLSVVVHALIAAITYRMDMEKNRRVTPPFHYQYQDSDRRKLS